MFGPSLLQSPLLLAAALLLAPAASGASQHSALPITIDPIMVKGAAGAPVTIVEFSDYQ